MTGQSCCPPQRSLKYLPFSWTLGTVANSPLILRTLLSSHPFRQNVRCPNVRTLAMSGKAAVRVQLEVISIPYICKCPVAFKAQLCILSVRIDWVILQKRKKNPRTFKQQRFISHSQHMFTTDALGTLFPRLLPSHSKTQGNGAATIQNIAGGHGNVTGGLTQKLNLWPPHDMCPFCSKFISQRKSLAGTGHKGIKKYNPKMCPEGKKTEMTIWKKH